VVSRRRLTCFSTIRTRDDKLILVWGRHGDVLCVVLYVGADSVERIAMTNYRPSQHIAVGTRVQIWVQDYEDEGPDIELFPRELRPGREEKWMDLKNCLEVRQWVRRLKRALETTNKLGWHWVHACQDDREEVKPLQARLADAEYWERCYHETSDILVARTLELEQMRDERDKARDVERNLRESAEILQNIAAHNAGEREDWKAHAGKLQAELEKLKAPIENWRDDPRCCRCVFYAHAKHYDDDEYYKDDVEEKENGGSR